MVWASNGVSRVFDAALEDWKRCDDEETNCMLCAQKRQGATSGLVRKAVEESRDVLDARHVWTAVLRIKRMMITDCVVVLLPE